MAEQRIELKVYRVRYICDVCNTGQLLPMPHNAAVSRPGERFLHVCTKCGHTQDFGKETYPKLVHEEAGEWGM